MIWITFLDINRAFKCRETLKKKKKKKKKYKPCVHHKIVAPLEFTTIYLFYGARDSINKIVNNNPLVSRQHVGRHAGS